MYFVAKLMSANFAAASNTFHQSSPKVEAFSRSGIVEEDASISRQVQREKTPEIVGKRLHPVIGQANIA